MKKLPIFITGLLCLSLSSCLLFHDGDESTSEIPGNSTEVQKEDSTTKEGTTSKEDSTSKEDGKKDDNKPVVVDPEKETEKEKETPSDNPPISSEYYTATFYSYEGKEFKTVQQEKGKGVVLSSVVSNTNKPYKPGDLDNDIGYNFTNKWQVINGALAGNIYTPTSKNFDNCVLFSVDYDIEYIAVYEKTSYYAEVNFYDDIGKVCTIKSPINSRLCDESIAKKDYGYYNPTSIVSKGRVCGFSGWSENKNAVVADSKKYSSLPIVDKQVVNYYAIYYTYIAGSKAVFARRLSRPALTYTYDSYSDIASQTFNIEKGVLKSIDDSIISDNGKYDYEIYLDAQDDIKNATQKITRVEITQIGDNIFKDKVTRIKKLSLGSIVTSIGSNCFKNATIGEITSSGLTTMGNNCFEGATLSTFPKLGKVTSIPYRAFYNATIKDGIVNLNNNVETIGEESFSFTKEIKEFKISKSVNTIHSKAFRVYSPELGYNNGGQKSFRIKSFSVDENNTAFFSENGCVINKLDNSLIIAGGGVRVIPTSVKTIKSYAFMCNSFYRKEAAEVSNYTLEIPKTLSSIEQYAFSNMGFETYVFKGTRNEFLKIAPNHSVYYPPFVPKITFTDESNPVLINSVIKIF